MFDWLKSKSVSWTPPEPTGPSVQLRLFSPSDAPVSHSAEWHGNELEVKSDAAAIRSLFDVELPNIQQCMISYRFLIQTTDLKAAVYQQMWCRIPEKGQFFSQGIDHKTSGTNEWVPVEIPFYLEKGQVADLLHLGLAFEGAGIVQLKEIEVRSTPVG
jgi:hypothetical protein